MPPTQSYLLRRLLRSYGAIKLTVGVSLIAVLLSVLVTALIDFALDQRISWTAVSLSIITPTIIVPIFEYRALLLLDQLDKTEQKLRVLSLTDDLTGTYNRRYFLDLANAEISRIERYGGMLCLAIMDFDNFKTINDHYGHLAGDRALSLVSQICQENIRETDIFARYGGDEFVFLFPETDETRARECLQRLHNQISNATISSEVPVHPHVSIGLFCYSARTSTLDDLLHHADMALYRAKHAGGNRLV